MCARVQSHVLRVLRVPVFHVPLEARVRRAGRSMRVTWSVRVVRVVRALRVLKTLRATPLAIKARLRLEPYRR